MTGEQKIISREDSADWLMDAHILGSRYKEEGDVRMTIRKNFAVQLNNLQDKLMELGGFTQQALRRSMEALETQNVELALEVMEDDARANMLEEEINDMAVWCIAQQQPVASDLRRIIGVIKIATAVERIADYAVNIAKSTIRIGDEPHIQSLDNIREMHRMLEEMLTLSLGAFQEEDIEKARRVAEMDDRVDDLYGETIRSYLSLNQTRPDTLPQVTQFAFVCRFLERGADHCTNIAENVYYLVTGKRYDLNS